MSEARIFYQEDCNLSLLEGKKIAVIGKDSMPTEFCPDLQCSNGTLPLGWGSGTTDFKYIVDPLSAITKRAEKDGIKIVSSGEDDAKAGADAAKDAGGVSADLFERLHNNEIVLMPSVEGVSQIWTPGQTFFIDVAKDAFRPESERKYKDMDALKEGLKQMSQQIYDAINTLQ